MSEIREVALHDGTVIYIEMEQAYVPIAVASDEDLGLPEGATPTGAADKVIDTLKAMQITLKGVFEAVHDSVKERMPSEWGVELNIGFKGTTSPIPIIVSGEANASVKVHAKWKKSTEGNG